MTPNLKKNIVCSWPKRLFLLITTLAITPLLADEFYTCKPVDVTVYPERIHVRCDKPTSGGIAFFAVPTASTEPAHVARILSVLLIARATAKNVEVQYDPEDISGTDFGCRADDCRRLVAVGF